MSRIEHDARYLIQQTILYTQTINRNTALHWQTGFAIWCRALGQVEHDGLQGYPSLRFVDRETFDLAWCYHGGSYKSHLTNIEVDLQWLCMKHQGGRKSFHDSFLNTQSLHSPFTGHKLLHNLSIPWISKITCTCTCVPLHVTAWSLKKSRICFIRPESYEKELSTQFSMIIANCFLYEWAACEYQICLSIL